MLNTVIAPQPEFRYGLGGSPNPFREKFGELTHDQWRDLLIRSLDERIIEDIEFPGYPEPELQERIHGHSAEISIDEAYGFYCFVKNIPGVAAKLSRTARFLDFGAGWGRISRLFLRDFDLSRMYGYEPYIGFCAVARVLNPYICFLNGDYLPDETLPPDRFDIVVGWSVFSHLSEHSATLWLAEMARVMRPEGHAVFTTWGERFLDRLIASRADLEAGKDLDWYSRQCLAASGDISERKAAYLRGDFVWFTGHDSTLYGEAFIHPDALRRLIEAHAIPLELMAFDRHTLGQDAFVLRRR